MRYFTLTPPLQLQVRSSTFLPLILTVHHPPIAHARALLTVPSPPLGTPSGRSQRPLRAFFLSLPPPDVYFLFETSELRVTLCDRARPNPLRTRRQNTNLRVPGRYDGRCSEIYCRVARSFVDNATKQKNWVRSPVFISPCMRPGLGAERGPSAAI